MVSKTLSAFICWGRGSCTSMPCIESSLFSLLTIFSNSSSETSSLSLCSTELNPTSLVFSVLFLTYTLLAGFSPTKTTANPGVFPELLIS